MDQEVNTNQPETSKSNEGIIFNHLKNELGENNLHKHQYVTDILALRQQVDSLKDDPQQTVDTIKKSKLWKDYQDIQNEDFSEEELKQFQQLHDILSRNPKLMNLLKNELTDFILYRHDLVWTKLGAADVPDKQERIKRAMQHLTDVENFSQKIQNSPIASLLSLVHDVEKYYGTKNLLAEHELASAVVGGEILEELFKSTAQLSDTNVNLERFAPIIKTLARKTLVHGEFEYPELNAQALNNDPDVRTLFGGLHLRLPRSSQIRLNKQQPQDPEAIKGEKTAREALKIVSVADKAVGVKDLDKIFSDTLNLDYETVSEWTKFQNLSNTVIENALIVPHIFTIPENSIGFKELNKWYKTNLFILQTMFNSEVINNTKEMPEIADGLKQNYMRDLGDLGLEVFNQAQFLSGYFNIKSEANKRSYAENFKILFNKLHAINFELPKGSTLSHQSLSLENYLKNFWKKKHPQISM